MLPLYIVLDQGNTLFYCNDTSYEQRLYVKIICWLGWLFDIQKFELNYNFLSTFLNLNPIVCTLWNGMKCVLFIKCRLWQWDINLVGVCAQNQARYIITCVVVQGSRKIVFSCLPLLLLVGRLLLSPPPQLSFPFIFVVFVCILFCICLYLLVKYFLASFFSYWSAAYCCPLLHCSHWSTALLSPPHFYQVCHVRKISCHQYSGCKKYQKEKRKIFFNLALLSPPHSYYTADMRLKIMIQPNLAFSPVKFDLTRKENKKRQFSQ